MTRQSTDTCAGCARFDLKAAVENKGWGMCSGYEKLVEWTDKSVLHLPAKDRAPRKQLVVQLMQQNNEKGEDGNVRKAVPA